jgi:hypothetical protein
VSAFLAALLGWAPATLPPGPAAEVERLEGHGVEVTGADYRILDIAGEGAPRVGVVERRAGALWLVTESEALRLAGPLAVPRIAGPGYKVWVVGATDGDTLHARRLGVLAAPR